MIKRFDLGHINKIAAVSLKIESESWYYHYQLFSFKKGEMHLVKGEKLIGDLKTLLKKISKKIPVVLHISGKGILNRKTDNSENYRHTLLMNVRLEDFYFTDYIESDLVFSSIIRKDVVKKVLEEFSSQGIEVITFGTGPFIAAELIPMTSKAFITVDHTKVFRENEQIVGFEQSDEFREATFIGEEQYGHDMVGALSLALNYFYPSEKIILPDEPVVFQQNLKEARQKNIFYRFAAILVFFFLALLTTNYFYLNYLNRQIENNYLVLAEFEDQLGELNTLNDEKSRKEKLLQGSGLLSRSFLSFYLMEISNSVPSDVVLDQIVLRPLVDEVKGRHKIEFNEHLVLINGKSKSSGILDRWINDLKEEEWLAAIDILDYTYKKNLGNFELELILK